MEPKKKRITELLPPIRKLLKLSQQKASNVKSLASSAPSIWHQIKIVQHKFNTMDIWFSVDILHFHFEV